MSRIGYLLSLCISFLLGTGCAKDYAGDRLQEVLQCVDKNPEQALELLKSSPYTESQGTALYMQYIVLLAQAKYMIFQDIAEDSLILDAQRYFVDTKNAEMAARASYYVAAYWETKKDYEKELEYSLLANYYAELAGNHLFVAKSFYWVGTVYYYKDMLDSALVYFHQARKAYEFAPDADADLVLAVTATLCSTYLELKRYDEALCIANEGLKAAQEKGYPIFEAEFLFNIGLVCDSTNDHLLAKEYFDQALSKNPHPYDSLRIFMNHARLYRLSEQPDSALYYLNLVEDRIDEIPIPYTRKMLFEEFVHFYEKEGDFRKRDYYTEKVAEEVRIINELKSDEQAQMVNRMFDQFRNFEGFKQDANRKYYQIIQIGLICLLVFFFLLLIFRSDFLNYKKKFKQAHSNQLTQKLDYQHFLLLGTRLISKSVDNLIHKNKNVDDSLVRKQFSVLRSSFQDEMANQIRTVIRQLRNGAKALLQLTTEDLCIIYLARFKHTDKEISEMLGYEDLPENHIFLRRRKIRHILAEAGLTNGDIKILLPD